MDKRFLIMELEGRVGNQLFNFAAGYALAKQLGADLAFSSRKILPEDLLLPQMIGSLYREATPSELFKVGKYPQEPILWQKLNRKVVNITRQLQSCKPAQFSLDHTLAFEHETTSLTLDLPVYVTGFFQNEQYFADCSTEIYTAAFSMLNKTSQVPSMLESLKHPFIGVSFRRGNYNPLGWSLPLHFYERALDYLKEHTTIGTLLLFGDDWDFLELVGERWSKSHSVFNALTLGNDPISQLSLMADCEHCIVANSTFSWWGAWFGDQRYQNQSRVVIAPKEWISGGVVHLNNPHKIIPERWIKLPMESEPARSLAVSVARFENNNS